MHAFIYILINIFLLLLFAQISEQYSLYSGDGAAHEDGGDDDEGEGGGDDDGAVGEAGGEAEDEAEGNGAADHARVGDEEEVAEGEP